MYVIIVAIVVQPIIPFISCGIRFALIHVGGASDISLGIVLSFFTGSSHPPPMGFTSEATLTFNAINPYPTASTCGLSLTLPSKYTEYVDFKDHFIYGMLNHGGFGLY